MLLLRNVEHSVLLQVKEILANPPDGIPVFNLYGQDSFEDEAFVPDEPFMWVLQARAEPRQSRLPMLIVERGQTPHALFEVGNRKGHFFTFMLHVFGRNHGESSDLAAWLEDRLESIKLYDCNTNPPTFLYGQDVVQRTIVPAPVEDKVGLEGTLRFPETVLFAFSTKE